MGVDVDELSVLHWESIELEILPVEAMILLSMKEEDRTDDKGVKVKAGKVCHEQETQLRHIVYCSERQEKAGCGVEFSLKTLRRIDFEFEPFMAQESDELARLRIKISNAIHQLENALIKGDFSPLEPYEDCSDLYAEMGSLIIGR